MILPQERQWIPEMLHETLMKHKIEGAVTERQGTGIAANAVDLQLCVPRQRPDDLE
jgi:hypothetical protein